MRPYLLCFLWFAACPWLDAGTHYFNGTNFKGGYVVIPDELPDDGQKIWVVADVHGAGGLRNERMGHRLKTVLEPESVIFLVPSFTSGYQAGDGKWADQMIEHFKWIQDNYPVHDKMFVHGHSGGGQFAHRFAFTKPKYVVGTSAHSSGSWACAGGYGSISLKAKGIPFAISCGEKDTGLSVPSYEHGRLAWFELFRDELEKKAFTFAHATWPNVGHGVPMKLQGPMIRECFLLATQGIEPTGEWWVGDVSEMARQARESYGGLSPAMDAITLTDAERKAVDGANARIESGQAPDVAATIRFLAQYPASKWAGREDYAALKKHCQAAAETYLTDKKDSGAPLTGAAMEAFKKATAGLGVTTP